MMEILLALAALVAAIGVVALGVFLYALGMPLHRCPDEPPAILDIIKCLGIMAGAGAWAWLVIEFMEAII